MNYNLTGWDIFFKFCLHSHETIKFINIILLLFKRFSSLRYAWSPITLRTVLTTKSKLHEHEHFLKSTKIGTHENKYFYSISSHHILCYDGFGSSFLSKMEALLKTYSSCSDITWTSFSFIFWQRKINNVIIQLLTSQHKLLSHFFCNPAIGCY